MAAFTAVPFVFSGYDLFQANRILLLGTLAIGYNLAIGLCGLFVFTPLALYGVGAYTFTISLMHGLPVASAIGLALVAGGIYGALTGLLAYRVQFLSLGLATLGLAFVTVQVGQSWKSVTGGATGLSVPTDGKALLGLRLSERVDLYWLTLACFIIVGVAAKLIATSEMGLRWRATADNAIAADGVGVDTNSEKLKALTAMGVICAFAGALFAALAGYISPPEFGLGPLILLFVIVTVGGLGSLEGGVWGAILIIVFLEILPQRAAVVETAYGMVLLVTVLVFPKGLSGGGQKLVAATRRMVGPHGK